MPFVRVYLHSSKSLLRHSIFTYRNYKRSTATVHAFNKTIVQVKGQALIFKDLKRESFPAKKGQHKFTAVVKTMPPLHTETSNIAEGTLKPQRPRSMQKGKGCYKGLTEKILKEYQHVEKENEKYKEQFEQAFFQVYGTFDKCLSNRIPLSSWCIVDVELDTGNPYANGGRILL